LDRTKNIGFSFGQNIGHQLIAICQMLLLNFWLR
jgi:hypothetical protein